MNISVLSDRELLLSTKELVKKENVITLQIIEHLEEIESRRLYTDLKYGSLFDYCQHELGYTKAEAYRRIDAMRFCKKVPEAKVEINNNRVSVSTINLLSEFSRAADRSDVEQDKSLLLDMAKGKSKREVEKNLKELRIEKGIKDQLPTKTIESKTEDQVRLHLTLKKSTLEKLKKFKGLIAHSNPDADFDEIINLLCDEGTEKIEKKKFAVTTKPKTVFPGKLDTRYIPAGVKRDVYGIANGKCQNCHSAFQLEVDHIKSFASGGTSITTNLQLLCKKCNQRKAIKEFGQKQMELFL